MATDPVDYISDDVKDNYRAIVEERGITWASLAENASNTGDRALAAWMRSQSADAGESDRTDKPTGRRGKDTTEAVAGTGHEADPVIATPSNVGDITPPANVDPTTTTGQ